MDKSTKIRQTIFRFRQLIILGVLCLFFAVALPGLFFTANNFRSILYSMSLYGLMICGATFPVLLGGIDRTVGAVAAFSGAVCCMIIVDNGHSNTAVILGVLAGIGVGMLCGIVHGIIVAKFEIPAFLLTLATSQVIYGLVQIVTGKQLIIVMEPDLFTSIGSKRLFEIPIPVYVLGVCFLVSYFILNHTVYGRKLYSVGGNKESSKLSGINVKFVIITAYMMSGLMAAIAGIVLSSMNQQALSYAAEGYENDVLAAIVVGGVSLRGGAGTLQGAIFGSLLIGMLNNGLQLIGVDAIYHTLIKGVIIIFAVAADMYSSYKMSGLKRKSGLSIFKKKSKA